MNVLEADRLAIGHEGRAVLGDLSFRLEAGATVALVGGNGSGKTTLLRTLAGLLPPLAGTIKVLGEAPRAASRRLAWLGQFQNTNPLLPLRARDVVRMAFFPDRGLLRPLTRQDEAEVDAALEAMGVTTLARQPVSELSGGQRQRVYLAYVLARRAQVVLLDEPLSNLDAGGMDRYERVLAGLRERGVSVVVATHNHEDAAACDYALALGPDTWVWGAGRDLAHPHH